MNVNFPIGGGEGLYNNENGEGGGGDGKGKFFAASFGVLRVILYFFKLSKLEKMF